MKRKGKALLCLLLCGALALPLSGCGIGYSIFRNFVSPAEAESASSAAASEPSSAVSIETSAPSEEQKDLLSILTEPGKYWEHPLESHEDPGVSIWLYFTEDGYLISYTPTRELREPFTLEGDLLKCTMLIRGPEPQAIDYTFRVDLLSNSEFPGIKLTCVEAADPITGEILGDSYQGGGMILGFYRQQDMTDFQREKVDEILHWESEPPAVSSAPEAAPTPTPTPAVAEKPLIGWVTTPGGHRFYIPEGFEQREPFPPASGISYEYYLADYDMEIVCWETTLGHLPFSSGEEWIDADYERYAAGDHTYLARGDTWFVVSGYDEDGRVYYIREQWDGLVVIYSITNSAEYRDICSKMTEDFVDSFESIY